MEKNYLDVANSLGFWIIALIMIAIVVFQSVVFMQKAFKGGRALGLSEKQLTSSVRSAIITSLGPSFAVLIGLVALMSIIGAPMAWMRLSVIGAVMFETLAAGYGAEAIGLKLGSSDLGLLGLSSTFWVMCLGSIGWLIITGLFTHKLEQLRTYVVRGKEALLPVVSIGAVLGAFAYQVSKFVVKIGPGSLAALVSGVAMVVFHLMAKNSKFAWLKEWSLGFAMVLGMLSAAMM